MGHASPNQALEPTPYSLRLAPAFGRGSPPALGPHPQSSIACGVLIDTQRRAPIAEAIEKLEQGTEESARLSSRRECVCQAHQAYRRLHSQGETVLV